MPRKKNKELEEVEISELDEDENSKEELDGETSPDKKYDEVLDILDKFRTAIEANQKYLRKLWERLKITEDNFRIHIEQEKE